MLQNCFPDYDLRKVKKSQIFQSIVIQGQYSWNYMYERKGNYMYERKGPLKGSAYLTCSNVIIFKNIQN